MREYGMSLVEYDEMFRAQKGRCVICKNPQEQALSVDHDHDTGSVRKLLCSRCNVRLSSVEDKAFALDALTYLHENGTDISWLYEHLKTLLD